MSKTLLYLRYVACFLAIAATTIVIACAGKALVQAADNRRFALTAVPGMPAKLVINDMIGAVGAVVATAGLGVIVSLATEVFLAIERRRGLPAKWRWLNEALVGLSALFLLGACIAGTIISRRNATIITAIPVPFSVIDGLVKSKGRSLAYRDTWAWKAVIAGWVAFAILVVNFLLLCASGVVHRREARARPASTLYNGNQPSTTKVESEFHA